MSKSQRLRLRDVRNVFRLLGECRESGHDPFAWRRHMFEQLACLVGAQVGIGGEASGFWTGPVQVLQSVDVGWEGENERAAWLAYMQKNGPASDPIYLAMAKLPRRFRTRARGQIIEDRLWYRSVQFNEHRRVSRLDACINSFCDLRGALRGVTNGITLHRPLGDRAFSLREIRLVHLFHRELSPLIGAQLASAREPSAADLSPRARQTLECLLEGDGAKQIAGRLNISRETVNQYVQTIYRHFGVHSRAELLTLWMRRGR